MQQVFYTVDSNIHISTIQGRYCFLHGNNNFANAPQCFFLPTLPILFVWYGPALSVCSLYLPLLYGEILHRVPSVSTVYLHCSVFTIFGCEVFIWYIRLTLDLIWFDLLVLTPVLFACFTVVVFILLIGSGLGFFCSSCRICCATWNDKDGVWRASRKINRQDSAFYLLSTKKNWSFVIYHKGKFWTWI
jgi:hypothetical protein